MEICSPNVNDAQKYLQAKKAGFATKFCQAHSVVRLHLHLTIKNSLIIVEKGGPGTGKTTSCKKLEEHGFKTISMNQVLDEEDIF